MKRPQAEDSPEHDLVRRAEERIAHLSVELLRATVPILTETKAKTPDVFGSALLVQIGPRRFLVTASHVLAPAHQTPLYVGGLSQVIEVAGRYITSTPPGTSAANDPYDIAVMPLTDGQVADLGDCRFLDVGEIDPAEQPDFRSVISSKYLVLGYRVSKKSRLRDGVFSPLHFSALVYPADSQSYPGYQLTPRYHLIVDYDKRAIIQDLRPTTGPHPYGASGGGVWRVRGLLGREPESVQLVAIPVEYTGQQRKTILCTRIGHAFDAVSDFYPELQEYIPRPAV